MSCTRMFDLEGTKARRWYGRRWRTSWAVKERRLGGSREYPCLERDVEEEEVALHFSSRQNRADSFVAMRVERESTTRQRRKQTAERSFMMRRRTCITATKGRGGDIPPSCRVPKCPPPRFAQIRARWDEKVGWRHG
jgi:hypothetical protein